MYSWNPYYLHPRWLVNGFGNICIAEQLKISKIPTFFNIQRSKKFLRILARSCAIFWFSCASFWFSCAFLRGRLGWIFEVRRPKMAFNQKKDQHYSFWSCPHVRLFFWWWSVLLDAFLAPQTRHVVFLECSPQKNHNLLWVSQPLCNIYIPFSTPSLRALHWLQMPRLLPCWNHNTWQGTLISGFSLWKANR